MFKKREKGQSLIEVTFFLIILLILVAGIVEVGAILQTKLTVVNAAREGTRFGIVGASDDDIVVVTQASAQNVINFNSDNSDIWVIRAKTDDSGNIGNACPADISDVGEDESYWCVNHEVGDGPEEPTFLTYEMVSNAQDGLLYGIKDAEYIAVAMSYDHQSIVGLPYAVGGGGMPVNSYTLMRMEANDTNLACQTWPIAIHKDTLNWENGGMTDGTLMEDIIVGPDNGGNFGWLRWNDDPGEGSQQALERRLTHSEESLGDFTNAANDQDHNLSAGDWVYGDSGWVQAVVDEVEDLAGQRIRILVYEEVGGGDPPGGSCNGDNCSYHVIGFVLVELTGDMDPSTKSISARYYGPDTGCK